MNQVPLKPRNYWCQEVFSIFQYLSISVVSWWLYNKTHKVRTDSSFFFIILHNPRWKNYMKYFLVIIAFCPRRKVFLFTQHPACLMNIQLLTELQANIHGNELINRILLAPIWFMKYMEVFMIFHIFIFLLVFETMGLLIIIVTQIFKIEFIFSHSSWIYKQTLSDIYFLADCWYNFYKEHYK